MSSWAYYLLILQALGAIQTYSGILIRKMILMKSNTKQEYLSISEDNQELVEDIMTIITVFPARMYGKRSHKNKQRI